MAWLQAEVYVLPCITGRLQTEVYVLPFTTGMWILFRGNRGTNKAVKCANSLIVQLICV